MKIAVAAEADPSEPRVAATPETVKKMIGLGAEVAVQPGAGVKSGILDADYTAAGAAVAGDALSGAGVGVAGRRLDAGGLFRGHKGARGISVMGPYGNEGGPNGPAHGRGTP